MPTRDRERGLTMVMALFALTTLLLTATTASLSGISNTRAVRDMRGTMQVHFVAESAISEALQRMNGPGVVNFQNEIVSQWGELWGTSPRGFAPLSSFRYPGRRRCRA